MDKHEEIEHELEGMREQSAEYSKAQTVLNAQSRNASRELNELLSKRPELVAEVAMGQRDQADILQSRERIRELQAIIEELSAGHDWLEERKKEIKHTLDRRFKEPDMYRALLREYEQFRDQFPRKYQKATQHRNAPRGAVLNLFSSLRYIAQRVNRSDEVEQFLSAYEIPQA